MTHILRLPELALGELEQEVLEMLWREGASKPSSVHERVGIPRGISVNTVSSALKRLYEKGLLRRDKVSHSYVYETVVSRGELQCQLITAIADRFPDRSGGALLAAFVDYAEADGEDTLRQLEGLIAARLKGEG